MHKTIFAFATPEGRSAIAVLRLSGPECRAVCTKIAGDVPSPRTGSVRVLRDPRDGDVIDEAIVFWTPGPGSFTGEDCLEFHVHGSRAVRSALLATLGSLPDCIPAGPGEFTLRAFLNGKTDLVKVEGLADLLEAETQVQRRQAISQRSGAVHVRVGAWREKLLGAMALLEASIDFSDEDDVRTDLKSEVGNALGSLEIDLVREIGRARYAEVIRDGFKVAIAGPPNVGKSSLINALSRRDLAIVTEHAGTTRDILEASLEIDGMLVRFFDMAGLRDTEDPVERIGVERARALAASTDLVLWLRSSDQEMPPAPEGLAHEGRLRHIFTKADLCSASAFEPSRIYVSSKSGYGIAELIELIGELAATAAGRGEPAVLTNARQASCVSQCYEAVARAKSLLSVDSAEVVCEELRAANDALSRLTGRIGPEEVLGAIFSRFCIGK